MDAAPHAPAPRSADDVKPSWNVHRSSHSSIDTPLQDPTWAVAASQAAAANHAANYAFTASPGPADWLTTSLPAALHPNFVASYIAATQNATQNATHLADVTGTNSYTGPFPAYGPFPTSSQPWLLQQQLPPPQLSQHVQSPLTEGPPREPNAPREKLLLQTAVPASSSAYTASSTSTVSTPASAHPPTPHMRHQPGAAKPRRTKKQPTMPEFRLPPLDPAMLAQLYPNAPPPLHSPHTTHPSAALPPSLWMSPYHAAPNGPYFPPPTTAPSPPSAGTSSTSDVFSAMGSLGSLESTTTKSSNVLQSPSILSDILADDFFRPRPTGLSPPAVAPSPRSPTPLLPVETPTITANEAEQSADPTVLAKQDPLAAQVWRMYTRTKAGLPHAQRMENLTWRMMAMALRKREEAVESVPEKPVASKVESSTSQAHNQDEEERGRRPDKGKGKAPVVLQRVVGFDGADEDVGGELAETGCVLVCGRLFPQITDDRPLLVTSWTGVQLPALGRACRSTWTGALLPVRGPKHRRTYYSTRITTVHHV